MKILCKNICIKMVFFLLAPVILSGCAMIQASTCNTSSAYAQGINDAKGHYSMQSNYASLCPSDRKNINLSYQKGYTTALKLVHSSNRSSAWSCTESYGTNICGYNCIQDNFNHVYCGKRPIDNCVKNAFNKIKCGLHCSVDQFKNIDCEKERYSNNSDRPVV